MEGSHQTSDSDAGAVLQNRYLVGRAVGSGERAVVREARDLRGPRTFAVKMLRPAHARSRTSIDLFEREILIQSRLRWPVVTLYDRGSHDGRPYCIAELVPGVTLAEILVMRGGKRLQLEPALWIAADIAKALHTAHSRGIAHANICPAKILVSKRSSFDDEEAFLIDFSWSRIVDVGLFDRDPDEFDPNSPRDPDPPGNVMPTRIVPEDLLGKKRGYEADLFGVGALLFEMIAGPLPAMEEILAGWKPDNAVGVAVPDEVRRLLRETLDPRPDARDLPAFDLFQDIMRVILNIHPPDRNTPTDPGPAVIRFHHSTCRPTWIDWRPDRARA